MPLYDINIYEFYYIFDQCFSIFLVKGTPKSKWRYHGTHIKIFKGYAFECYEIKPQTFFLNAHTDMIGLV